MLAVGRETLAKDCGSEDHDGSAGCSHQRLLLYRDSILHGTVEIHLPLRSHVHPVLASVSESKAAGKREPSSALAVFLPEMGHVEPTEEDIRVPCHESLS